ncbi:MAG: NUDIX hydrolase [Allosphingosinicella sp.]
MLQQYGVLAFDFGEDGALRILLITSRDTGRWVIPRGNPIPDLSPRESAVQEGYEEAGITGIVGPAAIGSYDYGKRRKDGSVDPARVDVFPLRVTHQSERWPESHQRRKQWFGREAAADAVDEPGLKSLIRGFVPPEYAERQPPS